MTGTGSPEAQGRVEPPVSMDPPRRRMLAAQMTAVHNMSMECADRAMFEGKNIKY